MRPLRDSSRRPPARIRAGEVLATAVLAAAAVAATAAGRGPIGAPSDGGVGPAPPAARWAAIDLPAAEPPPDLAWLLRQVRAAAGRGARYIVLPEIAFARAPAGGGPATGPSLAVAEPIPGPTTAALADLARELGLWIALGLPEVAPEAGGFFLTAVLLDDRGEVAYRHRKVMVRAPADGGAVRGSFRAMADTVDDRGLRFGLVAGDDLQVGVPRLAERGAEAILIPAAWAAAAAPGDDLCRDLAVRHAVHLVVANRRPAGGAERAGAIYTADGQVLRGAPGGPLTLAGLAPRPALWTFRSALGLPASVPAPSTEPPSGEIAELGRRLFVDPQLSSSGQVSCATCHRPELAFTNGEARGEGIAGRRTRRNVPSLLNVAFRPLLRWDGYASTLENFVKYPVSGFAEMDFHYLDKATPYVRSRPDYAASFRATMGVAGEDLEFDHIERALATYMRGLISGGSPFDRFFYGGESDALGEGARRGLALFRGKADCARCHLIGERQALLADSEFHFLGHAFDPQPGGSEDIGLGGISTNDLAGYFQTPSLRNVAETDPYMHDGGLATLEEVIEFFDRGGTPQPGHPAQIRPLGLADAEKRDLVEFLRALTGDQRYDAQGNLLGDAGPR